MHPERLEVHSLRKDSAEAKLAEAFGIPEEELERLSDIARIVGGDWKMKVELGKPGDGSLFDESRNCIQFDPLHMADPSRVKMAEFVAAHEGGHRAITRGPDALGLPEEKKTELYSKVGFAFGSNALEDPADNSWFSKKYEGLRPNVREIYDEMLQEDAAILGTPEINAMIKQLGYTPRFAHFGSEMIRYWHTGTFSIHLPEDVREALEQTKQFMSEYFADIPSAHPRESEVLQHARGRFRTYFERVWPKMDALAREDLKDERLRQMVEEKPPELPKDLADELAKAMKEAAKQAMEAAQKAGEGKAQQNEKDVEALKRAAKKIRQEGAGDPKAETTAKGFEEKVKQLDEEAQAARAHASRNAKDLKDGKKPVPVPMGKLSEALRKALEEAFKKLSPKERKALEEAAKKELETVEDTLNKELQGKLDPTKPESHAERRAEETKKEEKEENERKEEENRVQAEEEIKRALEAERTVYDRAYAEVAPLVRQFTDDLEKLFLPQRHPRWRGHFPTGGRLDLRKVMQFEARPETYGELWERKTIPHERDFRFTLLIDLSGSMRGETINETFKGAILIAETLARVGVEVEILGFQDELIEFKSFGEKMDDAVRARMSGMLSEVDGNNPNGHNQPGWNDDGYVLYRAAQRLKEQPGRQKFIIPLSDGVPYPSPAHAGDRWDLAKIIEQLRREKEVKLVGVGLGSGTEHVRQFYPNSAVVQHVNDLPADLGALFEDIIQNPETY